MTLIVLNCLLTMPTSLSYVVIVNVSKSIEIVKRRNHVMLFFAFILLATLAARLIGWLISRDSNTWTSSMRWGMAATLIFFGFDHLLTPERYLPMIPDILPFHAEIIFLTGLCEIAGAFGILLPQTRRLAGIMLAIYFVCVFPANIKNAMEGVVVNGLPTASWYYWVRLLFQPLAIWWSLYAAEVIGVRDGSEKMSPDRKLVKAHAK